MNPVENIWQYLRANWLSNRVFDTSDAIINAACEAWNKLAAQPQTITSIGTRQWTNVGDNFAVTRNGNFSVIPTRTKNFSVKSAPGSQAR